MVNPLLGRLKRWKKEGMKRFIKNLTLLNLWFFNNVHCMPNDHMQCLLTHSVLLFLIFGSRTVEPVLSNHCSSLGDQWVTRWHIKGKLKFLVINQLNLDWLAFMLYKEHIYKNCGCFEKLLDCCKKTGVTYFLSFLPYMVLIFGIHR